jgi:hypothetical protein
VRCTTGAGAGAGGGGVLVLDKEMQPEPSVAAARTNPRDKNFIMWVPLKASLRALPIVSCNDFPEKSFERGTVAKRSAATGLGGFSSNASPQFTPSAAASSPLRSGAAWPPISLRHRFPRERGRIRGCSPHY